MKKQLTKLLAFVLSVCMVVGMIPAMRVGVRADESVVDPPENVETQSGDEPAAIDTDTLEIWVAENGNGNGKSADSPIGQFVKNQNSDTDGQSRRVSYAQHQPAHVADTAGQRHAGLLADKPQDVLPSR